jgi:hypothetical protein
MTWPRDVSRRCEVIEHWNHDAPLDGQTFCGKPTAYWYPAQRGTMALCEAHAQKHLPHANAIELTAVSAHPRRDR